MNRTCAALFPVLFVFASTVTAEQTSSPLASATGAAAVAASSPASARTPDEAQTLPPAIRITDMRPTALAPLYVSLTGLQVYDVSVTVRALRQGATEVNPVMAGVVKNPVAFLAVKGAATFTSIYAAERLWRANRRGAAIASMAATNGLMVFVAAHNTSVLRAQQR